MEFTIPEVILNGIDAGIEFAYSFTPLAESTVVLVPKSLDDHISTLEEKSGIDAETLSYLLGLLACYPLGIIMHMLPYGKLKHLFSFFLGAFLLQFTIGKQWVHQMITSIVAYLMFIILPRSISKTVVPTFLMIYCTLGHLHRQYINYLGFDLDFTGAQMVITIKLYSMAYNLYDGEVLAKGDTTDRAAQKCSKYALKDMPNILEFLGYTFCFGNVLVGPAFEFSTYKHACEGTLLYNATDGNKPRGKIPSNVWPSLSKFLVSILCLGIYFIGTAQFPLLDPDDPQRNTPAFITDEMLNRPIYYRLAYMWISLFFLRERYYFAWKNAEGANNIWYAGFEGFDDKGNVKGWDVSNNIDIIDFETASNIKTLSAAWNKKTAQWLSRYVYIRTNGSLLAVYSLSAFWHGFYPGYYLFFLTVPLYTMVERMCRKKLSPRFSSEPWSVVWGVVCFVVTTVFVSYAVSSFQLLAWDWTITFWKSLYFFGHLMPIVFYLVLMQLPTPKKKEKKA